MLLAIFDIDGTLARSTVADDRCFVRAIADVFGVSGFSTDWLQYRHQTDSGLCWELARKHLGRDPTADECARAEGRLVALLEETVGADPEAIRETPGATRLIGRLEDDPRWCVAVATGSWRGSARFKLGQVGLDADRLALATSSEAMERSEILQAAIRKAAPGAGLQPAEHGAGLHPAAGQVAGLPHADEDLPQVKAVYVGDGLWDLRAARRLGIGFLGVECNGASRLRDAGVEPIVADFSDPERIAALLESLAQPAGER